MANRGPGREREWCSERCRKAQYAGTCVDCGAPTSGSEGRRAEPRCPPCTAIKNGLERTVWTRETIIAAIRDWATKYGEPPGAFDWQPWSARNVIHDELRARRFEDAGGRWPSITAVCGVFGSWNAAIEAAGFAARAPHGGGGNVARRRRNRHSERGTNGTPEPGFSTATSKEERTP